MGAQAMAATRCSTAPAVVASFFGHAMDGTGHEDGASDDAGGGGGGDEASASPTPMNGPRPTGVA